MERGHVCGPRIPSGAARRSLLMRTAGYPRPFHGFARRLAIRSLSAAAPLSPHLENAPTRRSHCQPLRMHSLNIERLADSRCGVPGASVMVCVCAGAPVPVWAASVPLLTYACTAVADMSGACPPRSLLVESSSAFGNPRLTFHAARTLSDMGVGGILLGDAVGGGLGGVRSGATQARGGVRAAKEMLHCVRAAKAAGQHHGGAVSDGRLLVLVRSLVSQSEGLFPRGEELRRLRAALACGADGVVVDVSGSRDDRLERVQGLCSELLPSRGVAGKGAESDRGAMVLVRMAAGSRVLSEMEQAKLVSAGVCGVLRPDDVSLRAAAAAQACLHSLLSEEGRHGSSEEIAADHGGHDGGGEEEGSSKASGHGLSPRSGAEVGERVLGTEEMQRLAAGARNAGLQLVDELHLE